MSRTRETPNGTHFTVHHSTLPVLPVICRHTSLDSMLRPGMTSSLNEWRAAPCVRSLHWSEYCSCMFLPAPSACDGPTSRGRPWRLDK